MSVAAASTSAAKRTFCLTAHEYDSDESQQMFYRATSETSAVQAVHQELLRYLNPQAVASHSSSSTAPARPARRSAQIPCIEKFWHGLLLAQAEFLIVEDDRARQARGEGFYTPNEFERLMDAADKRMTSRWNGPKVTDAEQAAEKAWLTELTPDHLLTLLKRGVHLFANDYSCRTDFTWAEKGPAIVEC